MSRLDDLNPPQRAAVTTTEGPLLVLAGAGSGKTRVITHRIAHLLDRGVPPDAICAVSFTNKAAEEMRERVERMVGPAAAKRLTLSTFHALGLAILKQERAALGFASGFTIYDAADQLGCVRECLRDIRLDDRRFDVKAILFRISRAKNAFLGPGDLPASEHDYDAIAREVYPRYQRALAGFHALDFDDLIVETVRLFDRDAAVRARWQERWRYLMVDEYQDTNRTQFLLVRHLAALHNNLCVVGDDDQSIYAWRGAEAGHILEFEHHFPGARRITLEENYRSTGPILAAANAVIARNAKRHAKVLFTSRGGGEKLRLVVAPDGDAEARFVAEEIDLLRERQGVKPRDCAVLYRSNLQARAFEEALRTQRLAYRVVGGQSFFERKEVKDAMAYLKACLHPRDEIALRRIVNYPARGIGDTSLERCAAFAALHKTSLWDALRRAGEIAEPPIADRPREAIAAFVALLEGQRASLAAGRGLAAAARTLCEAAGLRDDLVAGSTSASAAQRRIENLEGFFQGLDAWERRTPGARLLDYLHALALASSDDDDGEGTSDQVTLCTLHGAKGLEFPVVFLVGLEEELLPHRRTLYPQGPDVADASIGEPSGTRGEARADGSAGGVARSIDLSEERRLLYVGITRARERLILTRARQRSGRGSLKPRTPSRFLDEIPPDLIEARDLEVPVIGDAADEEKFAREMLARLRAMVSE